MRTCVVSDLHIGSRYFLRDEFARFLQQLPPDAALVLNGDVVDRRHARLPQTYDEALQTLRQEAERRPVVWVRGNHDYGFVPDDPGRIRMVPFYEIGKRLYVAHGFDFDNVMPRSRIFMFLFRTAHRILVRLGAEPVHVAYFAKRFQALYAVLRRHILRNAVAFAQKNGYAAVACGHTHYAEDCAVDGVRYFNTGAWTEKPLYWLDVTDTDMKLTRVAAP